MSNLRLSNESLMFYKRSKNNAMPHGFKPFVSFVHDESDEESDDSDSDSILLTPRLKAHSRKMMESDEKVSGVTPLAGTIPVNLAKRLSSSVPDSTPNRILSVALEQSVHNGFNGFDEEDASHSTKKRYKKQQIENEHSMNGTLTPENNDPIVPRKKGGRLQTKKKAVEHTASDKETIESDMENSPQKEPKITKRKPHVNRMANNKTTAKAGPKSSKTRKNQQKNDSPLANNAENLNESVELSDSENESINSEHSPQKGKKANKKKMDSNNHTTNGKIAKSTNPKGPKSSKTRKNQQKDESPIVMNADNIDDSTEEVESVNTKPKAKRGRKPKIDTKVAAKKTTRSKLAENPPPSELVAPASTGKRTYRGNIQTSNIDSTIDSVIESLHEQENAIDQSDHVTRRTARGKTTSKSLKNSVDENTVTAKVGVDTSQATEKKPRGRGRPKKSIEVPTDIAGGSSSLAESPSKSSKLYLAKSPAKTTLSSGTTEKVLDDITEEQSESSSFELEERHQKNADRFMGIESDTSSSVGSDEEEDSIFSGRFPSRKIPTPNKLTTPLELYRSPIRNNLPNGSVSGSATPKSSFKRQSVLISPRSIIPVPKRKVSLFMEPQPDKSNSVTEQLPESPAPTEEILMQSASRRTPFKAGPSLRTGTPSVSLKGTPLKSGIKDPKEVQVTPVTSRSTEKTKHSAKTPALKRKSNLDVSQTHSSASKRLRVLLNTSQQKSIEIDEESDLVHAVAKRTGAASQIFKTGTARSSAIDPDSLPIPPGQPTRYNPYMAPVEDPVRARLLMSTEKYRVSWLHLQPKCIFSLRVYSGMTLMRVEGNIEIRSDPSVPSNFVLNPSVRSAELDAGILCHILNTGDEVATFQTTEVLR